MQQFKQQQYQQRHLANRNEMHVPGSTTATHCCSCLTQYVCVSSVCSDEAGNSANVLLEMAHRSRVVELLILHVQVRISLLVCLSVCLSVCVSL